MKEYRRKRYFIDKDFQGRVVIAIILVSSAGLLLTLSLFNYLSYTNVESLRWRTHLELHTIGDIVRPYLISSGISGIALTAFALYALLDSLLQKTAGPIYRMAKDIKYATEGDLSRDIFLRKGDDFKDTAIELNRMIASLRTNSRHTIEKFTDIRRIVDSLEYVMDKPEIADQKCQQLMDDLQTLKEISNKYG